MRNLKTEKTDLACWGTTVGTLLGRGAAQSAPPPPQSRGASRLSRSHFPVIGKADYDITKLKPGQHHWAAAKHPEGVRAPRSPGAVARTWAQPYPSRPRGRRATTADCHLSQTPPRRKHWRAAAPRRLRGCEMSFRKARVHMHSLQCGTCSRRPRQRLWRVASSHISRVPARLMQQSRIHTMTTFGLHRFPERARTRRSGSKVCCSDRQREVSGAGVRASRSSGRRVMIVPRHSMRLPRWCTRTPRMMEVGIDPIPHARRDPCRPGHAIPRFLSRHSDAQDLATLLPF